MRRAHFPKHFCSLWHFMMFQLTVLTAEVRRIGFVKAQT
jgi:hypothetical protein